VVGKVEVSIDVAALKPQVQDALFRVTEPLEAEECRALILELPHKMRVIGFVAATTGLRISEVLGLKWMDIHWRALHMEVTRSVVDGIRGKVQDRGFQQTCTHRSVHRRYAAGLEEGNLLRAA
jgi:integrase